MSDAGTPEKPADGQQRPQRNENDMTHRIPLNELTNAQLDQLYDRAERTDTAEHERALDNVALHAIAGQRDAAETAVRELAEAIRLTREYVGEELLPAVEGWSWYDALQKWAPEYLAAMLASPATPEAHPDCPVTGEASGQ